jgi:radical SAM protein with 4Fe4S-binding SPASM domain
MIEEKTHESFIGQLYKDPISPYPVCGQIELTYRCNLDCLHCYSKGLEGEEELTTSEWKDILGQLRSAGTVRLVVTGGEPFMREDFFELYDFARGKGFLVSIFTNGTLLDDESIRYLRKNPPYSIEITLNGRTKRTYETVSQVNGSFEKAMANIYKLASGKLPLSLKAVGLKENKDEIRDIKLFTENLLGKKRFKFDSFIIPRLNGDRVPCLHRLSAAEITALEVSDPEMGPYREGQLARHRSFPRAQEHKYHCNTHLKNFYITPYGSLRFCHITDKYSSDLKRIPFKEGFYGVFPLVLEERSRKASKCTNCSLREFCNYCPARAYLETGSEDGPVPYYCELAKTKRERVMELQGKILIKKGG